MREGEGEERGMVEPCFNQQGVDVGGGDIYGDGFINVLNLSNGGETLGAYKPSMKFENIYLIENNLKIKY